jgi:hypothetical protein
LEQSLSRNYSGRRGLDFLVCLGFTLKGPFSLPEQVAKKLSAEGCSPFGQCLEASFFLLFVDKLLALIDSRDRPFRPWPFDHRNVVVVVLSLLFVWFHTIKSIRLFKTISVPLPEPV